MCLTLKVFELTKEQSFNQNTDIIWITSKSRASGHRVYGQPAVSVCALCTETLVQTSLCVTEYVYVLIAEVVWHEKKRNSE